MSVTQESCDSCDEASHVTMQANKLVKKRTWINPAVGHVCSIFTGTLSAIWTCMHTCLQMACHGVSSDKASKPHQVHFSSGKRVGAKVLGLDNFPGNIHLFSIEPSGYQRGCSGAVTVRYKAPETCQCDVMTLNPFLKACTVSLQQHKRPSHREYILIWYFVHLILAKVVVFSHVCFKSPNPPCIKVYRARYCASHTCQIIQQQQMKNGADGTCCQGHNGRHVCSTFKP